MALTGARRYHLVFMPIAPSTPAPRVPQDATIATLVPADAVGTLTLDDGSTLRFGASACRGFTPAVGVRVRVVATRPHPLGGHAAASLELASSAGDYDDLVAARDRAAGIAREDDPLQAAHTSLQLGWISMMELVPITQAELERCRREGSAGLRGEIGPISVANRASRWAMQTA